MTASPNRQATLKLIRVFALVLVLALAGLGGVFVLRKRPADPLTALERRVRDGRASAAETVQLGEVYLQRGEPLRAAEMAFRARKADPNLAAAHHLLGTLYLAGGDPAKARASFREAVRVAPEALGPRLSLARFEVDQRNVPAALEQAQAAVKIDRNSAEAWLLAGKIQRLAHSDSSSRASFQRAITLDPNLAEAQFELGVLALDFDNYAEAVAPLDRAYQLGLRTPQSLCCLALALVAGPGDEASAARAEQLLTEAGRPENPAAWFAQGLLLQRKKQFSAAQESFEKVLRVNPRNERAQFARAMCYRDAGNLDAAQQAMLRHDQLVKRRQHLKQLADAVQAQPTSPASLKAYGVALFQDGDPAAAEAQFRTWVAREPHNAEAESWLQRAVQARKQAPRGPAGASKG
jgi:Tfp pilus assembly protein PilF